MTTSKLPTRDGISKYGLIGARNAAFALLDEVERLERFRELWFRHTEEMEQRIGDSAILRAELAATKAHNCGDPLCPGQDGDVCHYQGEDAWTPLIDQLAAAKARIEEQTKCIMFFRSVIKSGESWTETCEQAFTAALEPTDD